MRPKKVPRLVADENSERLISGPKGTRRLLPGSTVRRSGTQSPGMYDFAFDVRRLVTREERALFAVTDLHRRLASVHPERARAGGEFARHYGTRRVLAQMRSRVRVFSKGEE